MGSALYPALGSLPTEQPAPHLLPPHLLPSACHVWHFSVTSRDVQRPHRPHRKSAPLTASQFLSFLFAAAVGLMKTRRLCKLPALTCAQPVRC